MDDDDVHPIVHLTIWGVLVAAAWCWPHFLPNNLYQPSSKHRLVPERTANQTSQPSPPPLSAARKKRKSKYIPEEIAKTDPFMGKHDYADENMYTFFIDTYLSLSLIIN
jgi:hypothetical protein